VKFDTTTVRLVLAIAEEGSISRAADSMGLAVAAASRRVSDLEAQLGVPLFTRQSHGMKATQAGAALLAHLRQIDNLTHRLERDALAARQGREGRVMIGAPKSALIPHLARSIASVQRKYPAIAVQIVEENSGIVQQLRQDRVIDIGIFEKTSGYSDLPRHAYHDDHLELIYSQRHFSFSEAALKIEQLIELPLVTLGRGSAILARLQREHQSRGRVFRENVIVNGFDTMLALVREGVGVGLMPPAIFQSFHPESALAAATLEGQWHHRSYVLSFVEGHAQAHTLRNVVAELLPAP